ncbi:hypothetical protein H4R18_005833, partial [Coemansia javaensis]
MTNNSDKLLEAAGGAGDACRCQRTAGRAGYARCVAKVLAALAAVLLVAGMCAHVGPRAVRDAVAGWAEPLRGDLGSPAPAMAASSPIEAAADEVTPAFLTCVQQHGGLAVWPRADQPCNTCRCTASGSVLCTK